MGEYLDRFKLTGKRALVFGAAGGIGAAVAQGLAEAGATLMLCDLQDGPLQTLADRLRGAATFRCDVGEAAQVERAVAQAAARLGGIDVVVNLAYSATLMPIAQMTPEDFGRTLNACLTGTFHVSHFAGKQLIEQGRGGSVVHFSSIAGMAALGRGTGAYAAAKGGVNALVRELAIEWGPQRIRVNAIAPCQTRTPALQRVLDDPRFGGQESLEVKMVSKIPLGRLAEAADMVGPVLFLASEASAMVTGHVLLVDGGYLAQ